MNNQDTTKKTFEKLKVNSQSFLKLNQPTKITIVSGGPFTIAELSNVGNTWTFTQIFRNKGNNY